MTAHPTFEMVVADAIAEALDAAGAYIPGLGVTRFAVRLAATIADLITTTEVTA